MYVIDIFTMETQIEKSRADFPGTTFFQNGS